MLSGILLKSRFNQNQRLIDNGAASLENVPVILPNLSSNYD
jgi:hypothetical protein